MPPAFVNIGAVIGRFVDTVITGGQWGTYHSGFGSRVVRLLLRPGTRYDDRREDFLPFDRIVDQKRVSSVLVKVDKGVSVPAVQKRVSKAIAAFPEARARSKASSSATQSLTG